MKKPTKSHKSKSDSIFARYRSIFIVIIILLIALVGLIVAKLLANNAATTPTQETKTTETAQPAESSVESTEVESKNTSTETKKVTQYEGTDANESDHFTGALTLASVSNNVAHIRVTIDQLIDNSGTCTLTLKNGSQTYTESATAMTDVSTATCEGFDVPTSKLSSGTWDITIDISADNKTGTITGSLKI